VFSSYYSCGKILELLQAEERKKESSQIHLSIITLQASFGFIALTIHEFVHALVAKATMYHTCTPDAGMYIFSSHLHILFLASNYNNISLIFHIAKYLPDYAVVFPSSK